LATSLSTSKTVASTVTFDKFSTTVDTGKKAQVDYIVMQNINVFNMVLKAKSDFIFYFNKKGSLNPVEIHLSQLNKSAQYRDLLAHYLYLENKHQGYDKGFVEIEPLFNSHDDIPSYDLDSTYIFIPLTFTVEGYSTIIQQSKL
jgi:hypothetical protein